jgi:hypothetical protein
MLVVGGDGHLAQVILAFRAASGLSRRLDGGQQQRDKHADDGDHDQQLNQREPGVAGAFVAPRVQTGWDGGSAGNDFRARRTRCLRHGEAPTGFENLA